MDKPLSGQLAQLFSRADSGEIRALQKLMHSAERLPLLEQELALSQETHRVEVTRERAETESLRRKCSGLEGAASALNAELVAVRQELHTAKTELATRATKVKEVGRVSEQLRQELRDNSESFRRDLAQAQHERDAERSRADGLARTLREVNAELAGARGELGTARGEVASLPRKALREARAEIAVAKKTVEAESKRAAELQEEMENFRATRNAEVARLKSELAAKEREVQRLQALDDRVNASAGAIAEQIDLLLETVEETHHSSPGGRHQGLKTLMKVAHACCKVVEPAEAFCYWKLGRAE